MNTLNAPFPPSQTILCQKEREGNFPFRRIYFHSSTGRFDLRWRAVNRALFIFQSICASTLPSRLYEIHRFPRNMPLFIINGMQMCSGSRRPRCFFTESNHRTPPTCIGRFSGYIAFRLIVDIYVTMTWSEGQDMGFLRSVQDPG